MKIAERIFKIDKKNVEHDCFIWNAVAGGLNTFQSVIILMVLARTNGAYDAGIFSLGYSTGCLFLTIGNYNMRNYQVTDVKKRYSFSTYLGSRAVTGAFMLMVSFFFCVYGYRYNGYSLEKAYIIFSICFLKLIEAVEDVYYGMYQINGRLDIGSKALTYRYIFTITAMLVLLVCTSNLLISILWTMIASTALAAFLIVITKRFFIVEKYQFSLSHIMLLLKSSSGVFIAGFLSLYIVNAPKYAIDKYLIQEQQAYYSYIAMPVFVVSLLNNFLYQPILTKLAIVWERNEIKTFLYYIFKQILMIVILIVMTLIGGYFLGIPILSLLYSTDLSSYKSELLILLLGGGILAITGFLTVIITIIRAQKDLVWGYFLVSLFSAFIVPICVKSYGIIGAAWMYTILVLALMIIFSIILGVKIGRRIQTCNHK